MRIFYLIFLFAASTFKCFSHGEPYPVYISQLPIEGIWLNNGWKFYPGDNPDYARPDFDDSKWAPIDPTNDINDLPELWATNICWLRLRLSIDSAITRKNLSLLIQQTGASEIYLNGKLLAKFGELSDDPDKIEAVATTNGSFIPLILNKSDSQLLSIRFALQKKALDLHYNGLRIPAVSLTLIETQTISINTQNKNISNFEFTRIGIFFILAILHFSLFVFNSSQKANLYFFIYAFLQGVSIFIGNLISNHVSALSTKMYLAFAGNFLFHLSSIFFLMAVYLVLHYNRMWVLWVIGIISSFFWIGSSSLTSLLIAGILYYIPIFEVMRVSFIAIKAKVRGAAILISGTSIFIVSMVFFAAIILGYMNAGPNWIYGDIAYNIGATSIPFTISVYLALDTSYINRMLTEKLNEVKLLSEKSIIQEKEKQQILATLNEKLENQVTERTAELKRSLDNLKSTQSQLIQSEKMASLGELTAGIAHEIQNPLNFVNNFSELSTELVSELDAEIDKGNTKDAKVIAEDLKQNLNKINHHGKRAADIVKGMLQHSRTSSGQKELTDINALADEYLRLAYHGLRAKDKSFNAKFETYLDPTLPKLNVIPQDIGRVLLNLINNAFYAVSEKQKAQSGKIGSGYEPTVTVSTKNLGNRIEISVKDNGNGIPDSIKEKIFQPFFTTKPTGQGTGLGLSLSYDIVKAHGGEIKLNGKANEGSEFVIELQG